MTSADARKVYDGLANLAHAVRRTKALEVATLITPEGSTEEELLATADRLAVWIRGSVEEPSPWRPPTD